ncbi:aminotransferase class I/II-fold pyridoxal phosphate-dependent enzyme [Halobacillus locisalis]|nr:aminotransferase class I/II-fold pyridoxal phosphate-dependent enzyme [Halobacillus locisalis]
MKQNETPLYDALMVNKEKKPISFHVPGHKYGRIFSNKAKSTFEKVLNLDATEITGLDDLHAPEGIIADAQQLVSHYFQSDRSYFLVNGSTIGNLAMVMAVCRPGDQLVVQRNCHKSVLNGLELAGAEPIFVAPEWEEETNRYSLVTKASIENALKQYPEAKGVLLTYPDYFGRAYPLKEIAQLVHEHELPLLIDEAHGVHFKVSPSFPTTAIDAGADVVVQSAHKMAPAMTMASFLHMKTRYVDDRRLRHYLQMLQSSSPSYTLMASLDLARHFLANLNEEEVEAVFSFVEQTRELFATYDHWRVLPVSIWDDPLKLILEVKRSTGFAVAKVLEECRIDPELATTDQVLLTFGLGESFSIQELNERLTEVDCRLKKQPKHATIKVDQPTIPSVQSLEMSYSDMDDVPTEECSWGKAANSIAAEAVIPYPPGIPVIMKGERISNEHIDYIEALIKQGARFQNDEIEHGIQVFKGESM